MILKLVRHILNVRKDNCFNQEGRRIVVKKNNLHTNGSEVIAYTLELSFNFICRPGEGPTPVWRTRHPPSNLFPVDFNKYRNILHLHFQSKFLPIVELT